MMEDRSKKQLIIFGIDGGTFNVIDPLIKKGKLPAIKKLIESGVKGTLKSTYPPITAAAWVTFMTGKNPGEHGFFDFRKYDPTDYTPSFAPTTKNSVNEKISTLHSSQYKGGTIWDILGNSGYEMTVVAVPMTYPPWKINGRMVPGFPCPDQDKPRTYPPEWGEEIGRVLDMSGINSFNAVRHSTSSEFCEKCKELVRRESKIILDQIKKGNGEVFSVVFSSSDFAQHFFWKQFEELNDKEVSIIEEIYVEIDKALGEIRALIDEDASIIIVSDHGFMRHPAKCFNVSSWLLQENYISLNNSNVIADVNIFSKAVDIVQNQILRSNVKLKMTIREVISKMPAFVQKWASNRTSNTNLIDWNRTSAFRFKMFETVEGIVINMENRQEKGIIRDGDEYEKLRDEIIEKLLKLKDPETGDPIVLEAFKREDLYKGDFLKNTPDIIVRFTLPYVVGSEIEGPIVTPNKKEVLDSFSGIHSQDGIFIISGSNIKSGIEVDSANIVDVLPTILYDLGLPIPDDLDGKVVFDVFLDSYKTDLPKYASGGTKGDGVQETLNEEDEESMKDALKGLGYL